MRCCVSLLVVGALAFANPVCAQTADAISIGAIKKVDQRGVGTLGAQLASKRLSASDPKRLPAIARAIKGANPLAANWLRSTFEVSFDRAMKNDAVPQDDLLAFVKDPDGDPRARRMVFEWLTKLDADLPDKLIPGMLLDPSAEFRRDAVARLITQAEEQQKDGDDQLAVTSFKKALSGAIHEDQVKAIVKPLEALGEKTNVQKHFGFIPDWHVIGPFNNRDKVGYAIAYPPEKEIDLTARYASEYAEAKVEWKKFSTDDEYGIFDIAKKVKNHKGSIMYATTQYNSDGEQQLEVRLGTANAWKLWLNGKLVFEREEYHRSTRMDQYKLPVTFKKGTNTILLKVCQNEQTEDWAQDYHFQLRVCNSTGSAVLPAVSKLSSRVIRSQAIQSGANR